MRFPISIMLIVAGQYRPGSLSKVIQGDGNPDEHEGAEGV